MSKQRGTLGAKSVSVKSERAPRKAAGSLPKSLRRQLESVELTHPDRILYPDQGLTKLDLAAYYVQVSDLMLPYVVDRPLSLVRCPRGRAAPCFFQKHRTGKTSSALASVMVREGEAVAEYFAVRDLAGLLALVQMGVLEIHLWGARAGDLDRPDRLVFDLDPGPGVLWNQIAATAKKLRVLLADRGLESFVKTTGGKGLHVVVPVKPQNSKELNLVESLIEATAEKHFDAGQFHDEYEEKMRELIDAKVQGKEISIVPEEKPRRVINLMDALRESLAQAKGPARGKASSRRKGASKSGRRRDVPSSRPRSAARKVS